MRNRESADIIIVPHHAELYTLTIEDEDRVVGHLRLYVMDIWWNGGPTGDRKANIQDVWVHPDHRGKGYGSSLMGVAEEKARHLGCKLVELTSDPNNPERAVARTMYVRRGYEVTTEGFRLRLSP